MKLTKLEWDRLNAVILELHRSETLQALENYILEELPQQIGASFASWNIHNDQMFLERVSNSAALNLQIEPLVPALNESLPTHPLFDFYMDFGSGKVRMVDTVERLREHIDEVAYRNLDFYKFVGSVLGIEDQLLMHVSIKNGFGILLTFHAHREFTEKEHLTASILRGHILARYHTLESQRALFAEGGERVRSDLETVLTPRELEAMRLLCFGMSNSEISSEMGASVKTIDKFVSSLYRKLGLDCRTRVIAKYAPWLNAPSRYG